MKNSEAMEFIFNKMETNDNSNCSRLLIQECWQKWEQKNLAENKYDIEDLAFMIYFINIKQSGK